jgi:hypothetical protein
MWCRRKWFGRWGSCRGTRELIWSRGSSQPDDAGGAPRAGLSADLPRNPFWRPRGGEEEGRGGCWHPCGIQTVGVAMRCFVRSLAKGDAFPGISPSADTSGNENKAKASESQSFVFQPLNLRQPWSVSSIRYEKFRSPEIVQGRRCFRHAAFPSFLPRLCKVKFDQLFQAHLPSFALTNLHGPSYLGEHVHDRQTRNFTLRSLLPSTS